MESVCIFITDHCLISLLWFFLFIALVYITILCWCANFSEISCYKVVQLINQKKSIIIDIRDQGDFRQGYIINSMNFSAADIRSSCASELSKFKTRFLIIVCNDGVASCSIARYLHKLGFENIYVLRGGIISWNNDHLPLIKERGTLV